MFEWMQLLACLFTVLWGSPSRERAERAVAIGLLGGKIRDSFERPRPTRWRPRVRVVEFNRSQFWHGHSSAMSVDGGFCFIFIASRDFGSPWSGSDRSRNPLLVKGGVTHSPISLRNRLSRHGRRENTQHANRWPRFGDWIARLWWRQLNKLGAI